MVSVLVVSVVVVVVVDEPPLAPIVLLLPGVLPLLAALESVLELPDGVLGVLELLPAAVLGLVLLVPAAGLLFVLLSPVAAGGVWAPAAGSFELLGGVL
ncbi:MAG TPA: hypothetical protein VN649_17560 [Ramlibacter sp.]|nr:hypothetical protein [Ramlibacter sp.]